MSVRPHRSSIGAPPCAAPATVAPASPPLEGLRRGGHREATGGSTVSIEPDLAISLRLDAYAPRAARYHVTRVDRPSPDLRDVVMMLTNELVTRALQHHQFTSGEAIELRIWMPADIVRVELEGPRNLLPPPAVPGEPRHAFLIEELADRWSIDIAEHHACVWFEIDRLELHGAD